VEEGADGRDVAVRRGNERAVQEELQDLGCGEDLVR
jgi:hypothetical protein